MDFNILIIRACHLQALSHYLNQRSLDNISLNSYFALWQRCQPLRIYVARYIIQVQSTRYGEVSAKYVFETPKFRISYQYLNIFFHAVMAPPSEPQTILSQTEMLDDAWLIGWGETSNTLLQRCIWLANISEWPYVIVSARLPPFKVRYE